MTENMERAQKELNLRKMSSKLPLEAQIRANQDKRKVKQIQTHRESTQKNYSVQFN
jgi:hypothetical protein